MTESTLTYYKDEGGKKKGKVKLAVARGVRSPASCKVEWPRDAREDLCFGIATESRTYYLYSTEIDAAGVQYVSRACMKCAGHLVCTYIVYVYIIYI